LSLTAPHTPWVPQDSFTEDNDVGLYGAFVEQTDYEIGRFLKALKEANLEENTLVIFTSDNGPFWKKEYIDKYGHRAAGDLRGMKADIWEGGHRIPFIVKWPGKIAENTQNHTPISHNSIFSTLAEIVGSQLDILPKNDSESILPILLNPNKQDLKLNPIVHHSSDGVFAIRKGSWKLIEGLGSGGFSEPKIEESSDTKLKGQLYNLDEDPQEQTNLYLKFPEKVQELSLELTQIRNENL
jgi:arylsulfatase A-like enzyme